LTDIIVVNETELARYARVATAPERTDDIAALARGLLCRPAQRVVVTLGAAGAMAVAADTVIQMPGRTAKVVDTTGAGDCFCGVLAASLSEGADLGQAMAQANAAAALSTEVHGAAVSMPGRARTLARLAES
jgi:ribokinase